MKLKKIKQALYRESQPILERTTSWIEESAMATRGPEEEGKSSATALSGETGSGKIKRKGTKEVDLEARKEDLRAISSQVREIGQRLSKELNQNR